MVNPHCLSLLHNTQVELCHFLLGNITSAITRKRKVGEHEVDWRKPFIEMLVKLCVDTALHITSDFVALKSLCGGEDNQLGHRLESEEGSAFPLSVVLELGVGLEEDVDFLFDERDVFAEVFGRESRFDEFLLFHEDGIGAIVDDVLAEDRSS